VRTEGHYLTSIGTWMPRARLEFRHQFQGQDNAGLAYADLAAAGPAYFVHSSGQDTGNWSAGLGTRLYCVTARCLPLTTTAPSMSAAAVASRSCLDWKYRFTNSAQHWPHEACAGQCGLHAAWNHHYNGIDRIRAFRERSDVQTQSQPEQPLALRG